jgi:ABC-type polysaccharide/polyol phosphate export permease
MLTTRKGMSWTIIEPMLIGLTLGMVIGKLAGDKLQWLTILMPSMLFYGVIVVVAIWAARTVKRTSNQLTSIVQQFRHKGIEKKQKVDDEDVN